MVDPNGREEIEEAAILAGIWSIRKAAVSLVADLSGPYFLHGHTVATLIVFDMGHVGSDESQSSAARAL
jgi:hypothetical protein